MAFLAAANDPVNDAQILIVGLSGLGVLLNCFIFYALVDLRTRIGRLEDIQMGRSKGEKLPVL